MSQLVDSQALQKVAKTLQLSTVGAEETLFIDERLEQVLDVGALIRRGLTLAGTEGLYSANIRNTHSGSQGNVTTVIDVYNLGGVARPPFPESIPENQDLWLTGFMAEQVSGVTSVIFKRFLRYFYSHNSSSLRHHLHEHCSGSLGRHSDCSGYNLSSPVVSRDGRGGSLREDGFEDPPKRDLALPYTE